MGFTFSLSLTSFAELGNDKEYNYHIPACYYAGLAYSMSLSLSPADYEDV